MAGTKERITIPGRFRLWLGDGTAVAPADAVSAMPSGWRDVGFTTPDGSTFNTTKEKLAVVSHQSDYPTRKGVTSRGGRVEVNLQEWSGPNFQAVHGGGTVTEVTPATVPPTYKFTPPDGNDEDVQAVLELIDGTKHYRYVIPSCTQDEGVENSMAKTSESTLPLRYEVQGQDGVPPWYLLTDDPAFEPA